MGRQETGWEVGMRTNTEAAGVHLADCTLLYCRHELDMELKRGSSSDNVKTDAITDRAAARMTASSSLKQASPFVRVDGELISSNIAMSSLLQAEAERKERLEREARHKQKREEVWRLHDEVRHTIIDSWSLGIERLGVLEKGERMSAYIRERGRKDMDWRMDVALQHLADEARIWADVEQVISHERDEGRLAYHRKATTMRK